MKIGLFAIVIGLVSSLAGLAHGSLFVSSEKTNQVLRYHGETGEFIGEFASGGGLDYPEGLAFGPDGDLYVSSYFTNQILRYDGKTGAFKEVFVDAGVGELECPVGLGFRDDLLYVSNRCTESVIRFSAETGEFVDVFATGGLEFADSFVWGPSGDFYISSRVNDYVKRFDGETGEDKGFFVSGSPLKFPQGLAFGSDGQFYVSSAETEQILRYDGVTGEFVDVFAKQEMGFGILFHSSGDLLVSNLLASTIDRLAAETGEAMPPFVTAGLGGLKTPTFMVSHTICGDKLIEPGEQCDDGNTVDGDGCSALCETESTGPGGGGGGGGAGGASSGGPSGAGGSDGVDLGDEFDIYGRGCTCRLGPMPSERGRSGMVWLSLLAGLFIARSKRRGAA